MLLSWQNNSSALLAACAARWLLAGFHDIFVVPGCDLDSRCQSGCVQEAWAFGHIRWQVSHICHLRYCFWSFKELCSFRAPCNLETVSKHGQVSAVKNDSFLGTDVYNEHDIAEDRCVACKHNLFSFSYHDT